MKKNLLLPALALVFVLFSGCAGKGKESASSVAQKWCDLNGKVARAEGDAKDAAKAARKKFENDMDAKYKDDQAFLKEVGKEIEKCEDASEGK